MSQRSNAQGYVTVTRKRDGRSTEETLEDEMIPVDPISGAAAEVSVQLGQTLNMGRGTFESVRIEVGIRYPCDREKVDETYDACKAWCQERVQQTRENIREGQKKKRDDA